MTSGRSAQVVGDKPDGDLKLEKGHPDLYDFVDWNSGDIIFYKETAR